MHALWSLPQVELGNDSSSLRFIGAFSHVIDYELYTSCNFFCHQMDADYFFCVKDLPKITNCIRTVIWPWAIFTQLASTVLISIICFLYC